MTHIKGIGGVFFKAKDPEGLKAWYKDVLGVPMGEWGWEFHFKDDPLPAPMLVFSLFKADTDYLDPSKKDFMINFRVDDLDAFLGELAAKGVEPVDGKVVEEPYGKFTWILDPEGTKIELWQPLEMNSENQTE